MKKFIIVVLVVTVFGLFGSLDARYTKEVTVIKTTNQQTIVKDAQGHQWTIDSGDYEIGQHLTVVLDTNNTSKVTDDEIVKVK